MLQAGFRKGRGTRDKIANISWITEEARELKKLYTSSSLIMLKPLTVCVCVCVCVCVYVLVA